MVFKLVEAAQKSWRLDGHNQFPNVARQSGWEGVLPHLRMLPSRQTIASSDLLPLPHAPGAEMRLTLLPIEKLFLLWWILWSCGRCASVVQAKRQIHRVTAAITPGTLRLLVRCRIPAEERPRAAIPLAGAGKFAAAR